VAKFLFPAPFSFQAGFRGSAAWRGFFGKGPGDKKENCSLTRGQGHKLDERIKAEIQPSVKDKVVAKSEDNIAENKDDPDFEKAPQGAGKGFHCISLGLLEF
jgi:hypothetical protein